MKQVFFQTPDDAAKGYSLLLHKGSVVYTGITGRYIVPGGKTGSFREEITSF